MKINLLPPAAPIVRVRVWIVTLASALLLLACALLGASWYATAQEAGGARFSLSEQDLALRSLTARWLAAQGVLAKAATARQVRLLAASELHPAGGLAALFAALPAGAQMGGLAYANGSFTGTVVAPTLAVAAQAVAQLQTNRAFADVSVHSVALGGAPAVQISFAAELPGAAEAGGR